MKIWDTRKLSSVLALGALTSIFALPSVAAGPYKVKELGALRGGSSVGSALNSAGQVVGWSGFRDGAEVSAFLWSPSGKLVALASLPGGDSSAALAINRSGTVVGRSNTDDSMRAFMWTRNNGTQNLGVLRGDDSSIALRHQRSGRGCRLFHGPSRHACLSLDQRVWDAYAGKFAWRGCQPGLRH